MIACPHKTPDGECTIATALAGRPVVPWKNVCESCTSCLMPQQENYVTASIAVHVWTLANDRETADRLRVKFSDNGLLGIGRKPQPIPDLGEGPGTILHNNLARMGFEITPTCPCLYWIRKMNENGTAWSRANAGEIAAAMVTEFRTRYPQRAVGMLQIALLAVARRQILTACRQWDKLQTKNETTPSNPGE